VDYACVALADAELFLCEHGQGQPGTWLYLFIDDVETYYARVQGRGVTIVSALRDEPWGMREFALKDPDGHVLRVGSSSERR
jgi:uncharacterized glyoxalase superfamily protein PhnB